MNNKILYRGLGLLAFIVALGTYMLTVQPTVPFWDCGEFSAASIWQQVPHPPGAPLFLMIGKVFDIIIPFGEPGWRLNLLSVFSSAVAIWFLYFIIVKIILNFRDKDLSNLGDALAVYGSAFIGAVAFVYTDTMWFNAVESEVYALSTLFVAIIIYLMMRWNEEADNPGHERYLVLIAYLIGLSMGVHLLAILTIYGIALLVYFRKYKFNLWSFIFMGAISLFLFFFVYKFVLSTIVSMLAGGGFTTFLVLAIIGLLVLGMYSAKNKEMPVLGMASVVLLVLIFGFSTYTQILLRSNANSPMNENEPKDFEKLSRYLGREQYGQQRLWPRRTDTDPDKVQYYLKKDENDEYVYGPWTAPKDTAYIKDGKYETDRIYSDVDVIAEIKYMWDYQISHMYIRYFLWNFAGRESDVQDAGSAWFGKGDSERLNYKSGYADIYPIRYFALPLLFGLLGIFFQFWRDPRMALIYLVMFLLMGVLMALAQNQQNPQPRERDYFYPGSFIIWAMWIGLGAYMLIEWLSEILKQKKFSLGVSALVLILSLFLVPVNLAVNNWGTHNRANNYLAFDYSYNILQSVEENAILFTAGDNDTFPVWFLQDIMGVRRDVRIVNLSLGNTLWYVDQLKNREPWGTASIPLSFPDEALKVHEFDRGALSPYRSEPLTVKIPVKKEILKQYSNDPNLINKGFVEITFTGIDRGQEQYFRVQDQLVMDIIRQTKFERPVYFSTTASGPDNFAGLKDYLRQEGMALRICPVKQMDKGVTYLASNPEVMDKCYLDIDNSQEYSNGQKYGMKFRNLNNMNVYYNEVEANYMYNYRRLFMGYANHCLDTQKDKEKTIRVLNSMNDNIGYGQFPMNFDEEFEVSQIYLHAGDSEKAKEFEDQCIESCYYIINNPKKISWRASRLSEYDMLRFDMALGDDARYQTNGPYSILIYIYHSRGEMDKAQEILDLLYADWMKIYREPIFNNQIGPVLSKAQSDQLTDAEQRTYYKFINLLNIQRAFIDYAMLRMGESASPEEKISKINEIKKRFDEDVNGDQLLELLNRNLDEYVKQQIGLLTPKADTAEQDDITAINAGN